jgi:signal transduction histidine kinase
MRAIGWLRRNRVETACAVFIAANLVVMLVWPGAIRVPFFLTWFGLTVVYGFRVWSARATALVAVTLSVTTVAVVFADGFRDDEMWGKLVPIPCLAAIFLAMAWHARRRAIALDHAEELAASRASMLGRQQQFTHDASHELRTPLTIARGHLELLARETASPELMVALDELQRMERIVDRLLLLAKAEQPDFVVLRDVTIDRFLEDVFMRWSEVAPRVWRLELDVAGVARVDPEALRSALDALLENAVKYTEPRAAITLRAHAVGGEIIVEVADNGSGVPEDAMDSIFDRFARADDARTRVHGGVGLGLAIVSAIAKGHGGRCTVERRLNQTVFTLALPVGALADVEPGVEHVVLGLAT